MADLSHLGGLNPVEQLDLGNYAENRRVEFRLPERGTYTLRAPESFPPESFGRSKAGALTVQIDPTIVGPEHEGFQVRRTKVSAKPFKRNGINVSQVGDYLKSIGVSGVLASEQDIADAVDTTAGQLFEADLDWEASNYSSGFQVKGMRNFPKLPDGTNQSWVEDPSDKNEDGTPKRLRANVVITRYVPKAL